MSRLKEQLVDKGPLAAVSVAVTGALVAHGGNVPVGLGLMGSAAVLSMLAAVARVILRRLLNDLRFSTIDLSNVTISPSPPRQIVDGAADATVDLADENVNGYPESF